MLKTLRARMMLIIFAALLPAAALIAHDLITHRQAVIAETEAGLHLADTFFTGLLMVLTAVLSAGLASRSFVETPVQKLLRVARCIAAGDLKARAGITRGPSELIELAERFDAMALDLELRERELRQWAQDNKNRRNEAEEHSGGYRRDLHAIVQGMQDVVFRLDDEGRMVWVTPSIESQTGYTEEQVIGREVCCCMADPEDKERLMTSLEKGGGRVKDWEVRLRRKDGTDRYAALNAHYIHTDGELTGIGVVARDITGQVRARDELLDLNRQLEERVSERTAALERTNAELEAFSYSVSHDLRAPLRSIEGFAQLVLMRYRGHVPEQGQDYLERIQKAAQRMAKLIDDLLSLSRINRVELKRESVDLSAMSEDILGELKTEQPARHVAFDIEPGISCWCDRQLCRIALEHLLGNAWKYTADRESTRIRVATGKDADGLRVVRISDNGVGFDMRYVDKLFVAFQRLHSVDQFEGTGIGLATVKRIVQRHAGSVWAEAEPGRGASFYIRFAPADHSEHTA